jgi:uncharacterized protein (DUF302 family)
MYARSLISLVAGLLLGALSTLTAIVFSAPGLMIAEDMSPLGQQATVAAIQREAAQRGWKVPTVHHIHKSLKKHGYEVAPVSVLALCQPDYAARLLRDDSARMVTPMMPCRISVYETGDGTVKISRMNSRLMSHLFGPLVAEVMAQASADTEAIIDAVLQSGQ